jgi:AcrR family transcriptional regulator
MLNIVHGMCEMAPDDRKSALKEALIEAAERAMATRGIAGIRARGLAREAGCAAGAIYTVFADLDELVLAVNARTLSALEAELAAAVRPRRRRAAGGADRAAERLVRLACAYLDFAASNKERWRAMFEFRLPEGKDVPDWFVADRSRLFGYIEHALGDLLPAIAPKERSALARSLFAAVHGIVILGLEEKLGLASLGDLRAQTKLVVEALATGLMSGGIAGRDSPG